MAETIKLTAPLAHLIGDGPAAQVASNLAPKGRDSITPLPTPAELAEMRRVYARSTPGRWNWWTSNSMRRLSTDADGKDGGVMYAYNASDGVPDIAVSKTDMAFVEMAHDRWPHLLDAVETLTAQNACLQAEVLEQARLNGMGGEREADLLGKVARLERELARLRGDEGADGWYSTMRREVEAAHAARRGMTLCEALAEMRARFPAPTPEALALIADLRGGDDIPDIEAGEALR